MKKTSLIILVAVGLMAAGCGRKATVRELNIVPEPVFFVQKEGSFTLNSTPKISVVGMGQNTSTVKYILKTLRHSHLRPKLVAASHSSDIDLILYDTLNPEIGDEGYLLEVRSTGIRIIANRPAGILYGFQTLMQMLPADISRVSYSNFTLPECTILDHPRFAWRGVHLDVSRHFFPVKFIKKYLDVMAQYKMNKFHFHLTDDHGWRLPCEQYPALNTIGSWRVDRSDQPWGHADPPREGERPSYGGYYTRDELLDIVEYAAERGIEVIPEIEMPAHSAAILAAYPTLSCTGQPTSVAIGPCWPSPVLCAGNDSTLALLYAVVDEVCDIFPSKYIHIGGDEAFKDAWRACPKCQRRIVYEHLSGEEQLQSWLIAKVQKHAAEKGRTIIGWDEIMGVKESNWAFEAPINDRNPLLGDDAVVMSWRGLKGGMEVARAGRKVIMCPTEFCYLDYYQADVRYQPASIGGMITLKKAYEFDPAPMGTNLHVEANILGGQCNLWTEFINTPQHAEYMLLPRMLAISECLWSPRECKDWNHFRRKVEEHKERLRIKDYNFCEGSFTPHFELYPSDTAITVAISTEVPNTYIFYTTDLSTPTRESNIYLGPINLSRGTHIKILPVYKDQERDSIYEFVIK